MKPDLQRAALDDDGKRAGGKRGLAPSADESTVDVRRGKTDRQ